MKWKLVPEEPTDAAADKRDAMRYRWLREQHWNESELCVVAQPKDAVKLGFDCPSLDRLDAKIDAAIDAANRNPGNIAPQPEHELSKKEALAKQNWKGMDGAVAFHLIDRHADGWQQIGAMMDAWLTANRGY